MTGRRLLAVIVAVLGVAACTAGEPQAVATTPSSVPVISAPAPTPTPTVSPSAEVVLPKGLSAKEREAALEAVEAYRRFVRARDAMAQSGGTETDQLLAVTIHDGLKATLDMAAQDRQEHAHQEGDSMIKRIAVSRVDIAAKTPEVFIESCEDMTSTRFVDAQGNSKRSGSVPLHWDMRIWVREYPSDGGWLVADWMNRGAATC